MIKGSFSSQVIELFEILSQDLEEFQLGRVNSVVLLKALFELEESPIYDAIITQVGPTCFPDMLEEISHYLPEKNEETDDEPLRLEYMYFDQKRCILCDEDLEEVLGLIAAYFQVGEVLTVMAITQFLVYSMPRDLLLLLRTFGVSIKRLKKMFGVDVDLMSDASTFQIPEELRGFVRNLNDEYKGKTCDISGRDRECTQVWQTLLKYSKSNAVLIGEPGVGKTSIVVKIVHDILAGTCPKEFENSVVLSLDVTSSVAGTMYRGQAEQRFSALVDFLENQPNVILFIDEIHLINGAGACRDGEVDLANTLKPILAGGNVRVIGATTSNEYEKYFSRDGALKRRFRPVYVKEPKMKEVYPMLKKSIDTLSSYHGVSIDEEMVDFIILNAACFDNETCNPDRTKDLVDLSMVAAKQAGKTSVDRESVLANFQYHLNKFARMKDRTKRSTAYHEAGHCLVALCSKELVDYEVIAVSIMPSDSYLGVTVYEYNDVTPEPTMEYFVDIIAKALAGRVAEKMFTNTITSGAWGDLEQATQTAYRIVAQYGMSEEFGINRMYSQEITSDKAKDRMSEVVDKLIKKAMKRAEELLNANRNYLDLLVEALMENGIVGPKELKQIMKDIERM